jgi:dUTP pyrophosphatase
VSLKLNFAAMTTIQIKIVNTSANPLPEYATKGSSGMDVRASLDIPLTLQPLERTLVPTGLFVEIPSEYEIQIRPRRVWQLNKGSLV